MLKKWLVGVFACSLFAVCFADLQSQGIKAVVEIAARSGSEVWYTDKKKKVFKFSNGKSTQLPYVEAVKMAASPDGNVALIRNTRFLQTKLDNGMRDLRACGRLSRVAFNGFDNLWVITILGDLKKFTGDAEKESWKAYPGAFSQIYVAPDKSVWAMNKKRKVMKLEGDAFKPVEFSKSFLVMAPLDKSSFVYTDYTGTLFKFSGGKHEKLAAGVHSVSVGSDGAIWVVTQKKELAKLTP